ncbi:hypothetical protein IWQ49_003926 [Labrenzia sp. EL_126]|nr:hypothetical protein [Labrenzia sp. EL_126]
MSVTINNNGYVDAAFFTEVNAVRINKRANGEYVFIVFGHNGDKEIFEIKSKSPKRFPVFVKHDRTDAK